ncbi:MAG TPA: hypothetical protein VGD40_18770 [Chryseosolibacter sp.]
MNTQSTHIQIAASFLWIGFVASISFMEAWLKFTAPGVSLLEGLAIGQIVFDALNKVELALATVILVSYLFGDLRTLRNEWLVWIAFAIIVVQSIYILPTLSHRIDHYLAGKQVPSSPLHTVYVALEVVKITVLFLYGFKQLKK